MTVVDVDTHVYEPTDIWEKYLQRDYSVVARSAFWHEVDPHGLEPTILTIRASLVRPPGANTKLAGRDVKGGSDVVSVTPWVR